MASIINGFIPANGAIDAAITIAVLVIAFIGWLVQIAGQAKTPQGGPANRPRPAGQRPRPQVANRPRQRPRDERLQSEIDAFLRDVSAGRKPVAQEDEIEIEVIADDETEERTRRRVAQPPSTASPSRGPIPPIVAGSEVSGRLSDWDREHGRRRETLVSSLSERHLEASPLGAELKKHVEQSMAETLQLRQEKEQIERNLAEARAELNAIRTRGAAAGTPTGGKGPPAAKASRFAELLKDASTVKDAIVIGEVLGRPGGAARRSRS